jgi:anti-sigma B factor antagonist
MDEFKIETWPGKHEGIRIVNLRGPFTLQAVFEFQAAFRTWNDPVILLDVTEVPYMDSASLGAVISVHTTTQRQGRHYALVGVSDRLKTLFHVAGVDAILVTCPTLEEAERKFANNAAAST